MASKNIGDVKMESYWSENGWWIGELFCPDCGNRVYSNVHKSDMDFGTFYFCSCGCSFEPYLDILGIVSFQKSMLSEK